MHALNPHEIDVDLSERSGGGGHEIESTPEPQTCDDGGTVDVLLCNSPRFDINEFLKSTPLRDVDQFDDFNLASTFNNGIADHPRSPRFSDQLGPEPDFSALLQLDSKLGMGMDVIGDDQGPSGDQLIAFDELEADMAKDPFALFSSSYGIPPTGSIFAQGSTTTTSTYLPGPDLGAEERGTFVSMEHTAASTSVSSAAPPPVNWGMSNDSSFMQPFNFNQSPHNHQLQCATCQILRRIIHSNGVQDTKLEIHGCDGQSYHAVLQTRFCIDDGFPASFEQQMVEFPVGNAEYVKQFLLQYSLLRRKEGFVLRHDSLASHHGSGGLGMGMGTNAGCTTTMPKQIMGHINILGPSDQALCTNSSDFSSSGFAYGTGGVGQSQGLHHSGSIESSDNIADATVLGPTKPPKSNAAAQRERTGKLKMADLALHFHLPINAAAKELGICPTVLKKICRRNGMRRWPHRKIKSIERIIATLEQTIAEGGAGQGDEGIRMEIAMLRNERAQLCAGFLGDT